MFVRKKLWLSLERKYQEALEMIVCLKKDLQLMHTSKDSLMMEMTELKKQNQILQNDLHDVSQQQAMHSSNDSRFLIEIAELKKHNQILQNDLQYRKAMDLALRNRVVHRHM
jgi:FtsZ-binding cell division protein ZapB